MICYVGVAEGKGRLRRRGWMSMWTEYDPHSAVVRAIIPRSVWMSMWTEYDPHSAVVRAIIPRSVLAKLQHRAAKEGRTLSDLVRFILTKAADEK